MGMLPAPNTGFHRKVPCAFACNIYSMMDPEALSQFVSVTGATPDAAQFFLELSNGDVAAAVDQYFTSGGQAQQEESVPAPANQQQAAVPTAITPATVAAASSAPANKAAASKLGLNLINSFAGQSRLCSAI